MDISLSLLAELPCQAKTDIPKTLRTLEQRQAVIAAETSVPIKYIGRIPATLRAWCNKHPTVVREVTTGNAYSCSESGFAYDVFLHRGWGAYSDAVHTVIEPTVATTLRVLREVTACECDYCLGIED